jgi:chromosome segregation ATPase
MPKTDLDWLCEEASPEEMKRLLRLVQDWSQGDEHSFPVQLALLTRAQWRAAATILQWVDQSRELTELKLAQYRQQTAELVQQLSAVADAKAKALADLAATHTRAMNEAVAKAEGHLARAESVATRTCRELENGGQTWQQAKADYQAERQALEQVRQDLEARNTRRDWLWAGLVVLGMFGLGMAIGLRIAG